MVYSRKPQKSGDGESRSSGSLRSLADDGSVKSVRKRRVLSSSSEIDEDMLEDCTGVSRRNSEKRHEALETGKRLRRAADDHQRAQVQHLAAKDRVGPACRRTAAELDADTLRHKAAVRDTSDKLKLVADKLDTRR